METESADHGGESEVYGGGRAVYEETTVYGGARASLENVAQRGAILYEKRIR